MRRLNCILVIMDYFHEARFDSLPFLRLQEGVRYVTELHESAASMWRRVDELWAAFRAYPGASDVGMCFQLQNWMGRTLLLGMSNQGCLMALNTGGNYDVFFKVPVADDGTRVLFWTPSDMECSRQELHSRANVERLVEYWLDHDAIPSYIPENYQFPWEIGGAQAPPGPHAP